ncbi:MAG: hypothetical protein JRJ69_02305 [Deltaproteobacteria bacterium]|nr:hypothetical protein [Deltaproteobacteria bacterium]
MSETMYVAASGALVQQMRLEVLSNKKRTGRSSGLISLVPLNRSKEIQKTNICQPTSMWHLRGPGQVFLQVS